MTTIFDGRAYASEKEEILKTKIDILPIKPKLVTLIIGDDPASKRYVDLKKKAAERVGIEVEIYNIDRKRKTAAYILHLIKLLNQDTTVSGIMVQLPLPEKFKKDQQIILQAIDSQKDVDGLREDSHFMPATLKAILSIMQEAKVPKEAKIAVVGAKGEVGKRLIKVLKDTYQILEFDQKDDLSEIKNADVIISATGVASIITADLVKQDAVVIDVGAPKPEVSPDAAGKASFVTPVPGGVGPVTIVSLLENVVEASYS